MVIFDMSYQVKKKWKIRFIYIFSKGLSSGNIEIDAYPLRMFSKENVNLILIHSFAKNLFLYGQRIGCLTFLCSSEINKNNILSQLKIIIRKQYSNPPSYGAYLVDIILNDENLFELWKNVKFYRLLIIFITEVLLFRKSNLWSID